MASVTGLAPPKALVGSPRRPVLCPPPPASEFHGLRDFFAFIKAVCRPTQGRAAAEKNNELAAHRNFGGSTDPEVVPQPAGLPTGGSLGVVVGAVWEVLPWAVVG